MMSPQPPRLRMKRRKTVSVTPAMGASTVAGVSCRPPIKRQAGMDLRAWATQAPSPLFPGGLSQCFCTWLLYPR